MRNRSIEIFVGLFMLAALAAFVMLAFKVSGLSSLTSNDSYTLYAEFDNAGGLKVRAPITIAGVKVGTVAAIHLDPQTYKAKVTLLINKELKALPIDTSASIFTEGILGANYISLAPGFETMALRPGQLIETTHSALILENLVGQLIFNMQDKDKDKNKATAKDSNNGVMKEGDANVS